MPQPDPRRIVVIGPCASGKTSLTASLQRLGYDALACGQEHSEIADLWKHQQPDVVIGLRIGLDTLRQRRSSDWPEALYHRQMARLECGFRNADLVIDSDRFGQDEVANQVVTWLKEHPGPHRGARPPSV